MDNLRDKREKTIQKEYVTWQDVDNYIQVLAEYFNNFSEFNGVYGPARGGLIFAVIISNKYGLPFLGAPQAGCLVVDDIVDSGNTALRWKEKGYTISTMYYKKNKLVTPDFSYKEKKENWIIFPWEAKE